MFRLVAAYASELARNHPFVDGKKRMAFIAAGVFLELNGWHLDATEREAEGMVIGLSAREIDEAGFAAWLRERSYRA